jgi:hypothetical protein
MTDVVLNLSPSFVVAIVASVIFVAAGLVVAFRADGAR